jgi:hypothetical protein
MHLTSNLKTQNFSAAAMQNLTIILCSFSNQICKLLLAVAAKRRSIPFYVTQRNFMSLCQTFLLEICNTCKYNGSITTISSSNLHHNFFKVYLLERFLHLRLHFSGSPHLARFLCSYTGPQLPCARAKRSGRYCNGPSEKTFLVRIYPTDHFFEISRKQRLSFELVESCYDSFSRKLACMMLLDFFSRTQFLYCLAPVENFYGYPAFVHAVVTVSLHLIPPDCMAVPP